MKILPPTTMGCLVAPTRFTAPSSAPGVAKSVLLKKRWLPTIIGILDSSISSTTLRPPECLPSSRSIVRIQTNLGILGGSPSYNIRLSLYPTTSSSLTSYQV
ncbi:hypothetical protein A2U01_0068806 [Trifolium medium]|uniref:Uncharacterized protein n=1 Tax=Trifolium medium TaxID=97028 RepID=A0A392SH98_9FABA|nr:hypothetical protein [Trifolium medium]